MLHNSLVTRFLMVLPVGSLLAGCAGVFNPYVHGDDHPYSNPCWAPATVAGSTNMVDGKRDLVQPAYIPAAGDTACLLPAAIRWAQSTRSAYIEAMGNDARLDTLVPSLLIGAAGVLTFQGATGVSNSVITRTAVLAGVTGGVGSYLRNRPKTLIYAASAEAISCALSAVSPLVVSERALERIVNARDDAVKVLGNSRQFAKDHAADLDPEVVKSLNDSASQLETSASGASAVLTRLRQAGPGLIATVDRITSEADRQLANALPNPQAIANGLGGLSLIPGTPDEIRKRLGTSPPQVVESQKIVATADVAASSGLKNFIRTQENKLTTAEEKVEKAKDWDALPAGPDKTNTLQSLQMAAKELVALHNEKVELERKAIAASQALELHERMVALLAPNSALQEFRHLGAQDTVEVAMRACRIAARVKPLEVFPSTTDSALGFAAASGESTIRRDIVGGLPPYSVEIVTENPMNLTARVESHASGMQLVVTKPAAASTPTNIGLLLRSATVPGSEEQEVSRKYIEVKVK